MFVETGQEKVRAAGLTLAAASAGPGNFLGRARTAAIFLDRDGRIRSFTPAASEIYDIAPRDVGRPLADLTHHLQEPAPLPEVDEAAPDGMAEDVVRARDGRWLLRQALACRASDGAIDGLLVTFTDITLQKRMEAASRECEEVHRLALEAGELGLWDLDYVSLSLACDDRFRELMGFAPGEEVTNPSCWARVHPEDVPSVKAAVERAKDPATGGLYQAEYRVRLPGGGERWLMARARVRFVDEGDGRRPVRFVGVVMDITERKVAEAALRESEARLDLAVRAHGIGIFDWHVPTGRVIWSSQEERLFGLQPGSFEGDITGWAKRILPEDLERTRAAIEACMAQREPGMDFEFRIRREDGTVRHIEGSGQFLYAADGIPLRMVGVNFDVTERRRVEAALRESEARFRTLTDNIPTLCWMADADGWIFWYNRRWYEYTGTTPAEMEGWGWQSVHDPLMLPTVLERWRGAIASGETFEMVFPLRGADGAFRSFLTRIVPVRDAEGRIVRWFGVNIDVTERRRAEEALAKSEERLRDLVATLDLGTFMARDMDGTIRFWSAGCEQLYGWSAAEAIGQHAHKLLRTVFPVPRSEIEAALDRDGQWTGDLRQRTRSGAEIVVAAHKMLRRGPDGRPAAVLESLTDVTAHRRAEGALEESEERLRLAIEVTGLGIFDVDPVSGVRRWSSTFKAILGLPPDTRPDPELYASLIHPEDRDRVNQRYWGTFRGEHGGRYDTEYRILRASDGAERWVHNTGRVYFDAAGRAVRAIGTLLDVTERRGVEEALRESEALKSAILASALDCVITMTEDGRIVEFNPAAEKVFGYSREAVLMRPLAELIIPPEHRDRHHRGVARFLATGQSALLGRRIELTALRADGSRFPVELAITAICVHGHTRFTAYLRDITERKAWEERQQLLLAELSHRVKNTLAVVQGIARLTGQGVPAAAGYVEALSGRLASLAAAHELLTATGWRGADLGTLVERVLLPHAGGDPARLRTRVADLRLKPAITQSLSLVLHELATNATKHGALSAPHGRVTLAAEIVGEAGAGALELVWRERGGPPVRPPTRRGFGSTLLERAIAHQHKGRVDLDWRPDGLLCRIHLPLEEILEALDRERSGASADEESGGA